MEKELHVAMTLTGASSIADITSESIEKLDTSSTG